MQAKISKFSASYLGGPESPDFAGVALAYSRVNPLPQGHRYKKKAPQMRG
jgi:hypothetical protein